MQETVKIEKANIKDINEIWDIIDRIDNRMDEIRVYDDINTKHTPNSLKKVLSKNYKNEVMFLAKYNNEIVAMLNIEFHHSDYLFFSDKYAYIRYIYMKSDLVIKETDKKIILEKLFNSVIEIAKRYDFKYICGDVLEQDTDLVKLYEMNNLKKYRNRLCKKIK